MHVTLSRSFRFEAARHLPTLPAGHPCARVHGHGFIVELEVSGEVDPTIGWLVDYHHMATLWQPIHAALDHRNLNEVEGLENPTSEHIAAWIWARLRPFLPELSAVTIMETPETRCTYRGA
jgi:6-pyruvoyltetrahydropterin/6-carboxytetrahydropterin synthase